MARKTILIVDDEPEVLDAVSTLVRHEGYDVMLAETGEQALSILARRTFDLIKTDLMIPEISGWQLLEAAKQQYPDIKVVVLTGYIDEQGESILLYRNADGFLVKLIDVPKMKSLLQNLLSGDDIIGATTVEGVLSQNGFAVQAFRSPQRALQCALKNPPHLFLVDIEMPDMSGFEFYMEVRRTEALNSLPVIFLTGHSRRDLVVQALDLGVQGFVLKPFDPDDVVTKVQRSIVGSHLSDV
ncbi:MAG: hypothetical protein CME19_21120 [Gemmatimonadetes bacterium]|nr:hypothetical protein [Gemmatimonadota bacterium]